MPVLVASVPISIPSRICLYSSSSVSILFSFFNGFFKYCDKLLSEILGGFVVVFSTTLKSTSNSSSTLRSGTLSMNSSCSYFKYPNCLTVFSLILNFSSPTSINISFSNTIHSSFIKFDKNLSRTVLYIFCSISSSSNILGSFTVGVTAL